MAVQTKLYTFFNNTTADANEVNADFDILYALQAGGIDSANMNMAATYNFTGFVTFLAAKMKIGGAGAGKAFMQYANSATDRTWTIPDAGADDTFLGQAKVQPITGAKTFSALAAKIAGAGAGVASLQYANSATNRDWTIPDIGAAATFMALEGAQNLSGIKTVVSGGRWDFSSIVDSLLLPSGTPATTNSAAFINKQLSIFDGTLNRIFVPVDKASIGIHNLGLKLSAGVLTVTGLGNVALAGNNAGWVSYPSATAGSWLSQTVTADQSITSGNIKGRFGTTASVAWGSDMPMAIGVTSSDDTGTNLRFFITRNPAMTTTPASTNNIGIQGTAPAISDQNNIVLFGAAANTGYNSRPCRIIGACRGTIDNSAGGVMTITALDNGDGIGNFYNFGRRDFTMPLAQNGAPAGKYFIDNGGTAPTFATTNKNIYRVDMSGVVTNEFYFNQAAGGTAGAGAVNLLLALPAAIIASVSQRFSGARCFSSTVRDVITLCEGGSSASTVGFLYQNTTTQCLNVTNADMSNGNRHVDGVVRFHAFS